MFLLASVFRVGPFTRYVGSEWRAPIDVAYESRRDVSSGVISTTHGFLPSGVLCVESLASWACRWCGVRVRAGHSTMITLLLVETDSKRETRAYIFGVPGVRFVNFLCWSRCCTLSIDRFGLVDVSVMWRACKASARLSPSPVYMHRLPRRLVSPSSTSDTPVARRLLRPPRRRHLRLKTTFM